MQEFLITQDDSFMEITKRVEIIELGALHVFSDVRNLYMLIENKLSMKVLARWPARHGYEAALASSVASEAKAFGP